MLLEIRSEARPINGIYDMAATILSHAEGTKIVTNKENQLANPAYKVTYKKWIDILPLVLGEHLLEFKEILKNNVYVLNAIVIRKKW